eukprot:371367_1
MTKLTSNSVSRRRLILSFIVVPLFIVYLLFDIDFLIQFNVDDVDIEKSPALIIIQSPPINVIHSNNNNSTISINVNPSQIKKESMLDKYGFDRDKWHQFRLHPNYCPYFENICIHKQHFYVFNAQNTFKIHPQSQSRDMFGQNIKHSVKSFDIYKK